MFKITEEALRKACETTVLPIPFYDSDDSKKRKQIGIVTAMSYNEKDKKIDYTVELFDQKTNV